MLPVYYISSDTWIILDYNVLCVWPIGYLAFYLIKKHNIKILWVTVIRGPKSHRTSHHTVELNRGLNLSLTALQRQAQRAAKRQSGAPVLSVEEDAGHWADTCMDGDITDNEEQGCTERENGTVFVIPVTPRTSDGPCRWEYLKGGNPDCTSLGWMSELQDGDTTTLGSSSDDTLSRDLERISLGSLGKWTWDIHSIIIDLSTANFIDTVAIKTVKNVSTKGSNKKDY